MTVKPITPAEAKEGFKKNIPSIVITAFNNLLISKSSSQSSIMITFDDAIKEIIKTDVGYPSITRQMIFDNNWLDIEPLYRDNGWDVKYLKGDVDAPESMFIFSKK